MVHNTQDHWVSGRCPLSGIIKIRKHNITNNNSVALVHKLTIPTELVDEVSANFCG
jgi:hypothetical protein